jgi:hypothetical protein
MNTLYHGSPKFIDDHSMAAGTFFTEDKELATEYGAVIYSVDLPEQNRGIVSKNWEGHWVSHGAIPLSIFTTTIKRD